MSLTLTQQLFDLSQAGSVGLSLADVNQPMELVRKLGFDYLAMWGLYQLGADEAVFQSVQGLGLPAGAAAPAGSVVLAGMASILGQEVRRAVGM